MMSCSILQVHSPEWVPSYMVLVILPPFERALSALAFIACRFFHDVEDNGLLPGSSLDLSASESESSSAYHQANESLGIAISYTMDCRNATYLSYLVASTSILFSVSCEEGHHLQCSLKKWPLMCRGTVYA